MFYKRRKKVFFLKKHLKFGEYGVVNKQNHYLFWRKYLNFSRLVKLFCRRAKRNLRFFWIFIALNIPFTKKNKGARMGKGKGDLETVYGLVNSGRVFLELRGFRVGRFLKFFKKLNFFFNRNFFYIKSFTNSRFFSGFSKKSYSLHRFFF